MIFSSNVFLFCFLPVAIIVYYTVLKQTLWGRNLFLLLISLFFYAWGEPIYVLLMLFSLIVNYLCGIKISQNNNCRKAILIIGIVINLSSLFVFKYFDFVATTINSIAKTNISLLSLKLPIGISFYTFQGISYLIDVYRGEGKAQKDFMNVALYISFFPQLIAGPIVRYTQIENQLTERTHSLKLFSYGVERFILGLGKKVFLSNNLALIADNAFELSKNSSASVLMAWMGIIAYTLQIYFDFSGYSDMAIGLGKMFGFDLPENFNYPYIAHSISDFWRRWHMTLQGWYKDYIYIPLGGNRVPLPHYIFNVFIVWLLTGLWHGANWTFIVWGLMYFVILITEKYLKLNKMPKIIGHILTLFFIMMGWVIFRADTIGQAITYIGDMFCLNNNNFSDCNFILYLKEYAFFLSFGITFSMPVYKKFVAKNDWIKYAFITLVFIVSISYVVRGSYNPFIYFNF